MQKRLVLVPALFVLACFWQPAGAQSESYQVTFATQDCNGDSGFATVGVDRIYKIQAAGCTGPDGSPLRQMLVHDNAGSYQAHTLTPAEAENVMKEVNAYMAARRGLLERSDAVIIKP